ncbi:MAG TPA: enoyl-CoA hydratase-related protein [Bdellovibrionota bacterium]|jgi:enoyl-CoA hydratase|nr:enoyl-CoA hydratase-related protein [Bdellovibrionota bacterium]
MAPENYENVKLDHAGKGVWVLKVSRPQALNALNFATLKDMASALGFLANDPGVRAVVVTGEGEKAFIAGADITEMRTMDRGGAVAFAKAGQAVTVQLQGMRCPVIAAVNGFALGGGTEVAIACDFIFASENARFGQPEVGLGVIPGFGGTIRLSYFVRMPMAKELILSGRHVKADEALRIGLANRVLPLADLLPETIKFAQEISAHSKGAVGLAKKLLNEFSESVGLHYKLDSEAQEFGNLFESKDQREGMEAFAQKRKPAFEGAQP